MHSILEKQESVEPKKESIEKLKPLLDSVETKAFLSSDFLLWLWYISETSRDPLKVNLDSSTFLIKIWIDDRIVLESVGARAHMQTLRGGDPGSSIEAVSGLQSGKTVRELKVGIHIDTIGEFSVLLSAKDLAPKAVQLPPADQSQSTLAHRLKLLDILMATIDHLFQIFLLKRSTPSWTKSDLLEIQNWIESKSHGESSFH